MKLVKLEKITTQELERVLLSYESYKSIVLLSCEANKDSIDEMNLILKKISAQICGGVFPGLLFKGEVMREGHILLATNEDMKIQTLLNNETNFLPLEEYRSIMIFNDGLASSAEAMIESTFDFYGYGYAYVGGGAGRLTFSDEPCIYTNEGMLKDCTQLVFSKNESSIGVCHGYTPIGKSLRVTSANRNKIKGMNYEPAFKLYKEVIEENSDVKIDVNNFQEAAKVYPFGISRIGGEFVIRDPFHSDGETVTCIGVVPENSFVQIMSAAPDDLIRAARSALKQSIENKSEKSNVRFIVDCISRCLHMGDSFQDEIDELSRGSVNSFGILSIGEIANLGNESLEFYNKTCVVAHMVA